MFQSHRHIIALCATALLAASCSSSSAPRRASLSVAPADRYGADQGDRSLPGGDGIRYYSESSTRALDRPSGFRFPRAAGDVGRPPSEPRPLRRYAAMPRHMPHAPHVRQYEQSCLNSGIVQSTAFIRPRGSIGGGQCYIASPYLMSAAANGRVRFAPAATLRCQMVPSIETWVADVLRPAARRLLGSDVVELRIAASYACRTRNSQYGARLSEHGKANALDVSTFRLADGRVISVKQGWHGSEQERRFLRYVHRGACDHFSTVLGPNADRYHHDHFHFDLASHGRQGTYRVCK